MATPDLVRYVQWIVTGELNYRWYNKFHKDNKYLKWAFFLHTYIDQFLHENMGGKDWWKLPPKGRLHWEVLGWVILFLIFEELWIIFGIS